MRCVVGLCLLTAGIVSASAQTRAPAGAVDHAAAVAAYAAAYPVAVYADAMCPGIHANSNMLLVLRAAANMSDAEEDAAKQEARRAESRAQKAIAERGLAAWCRTAWAQVGDRGTIVPGLVIRH